tara:strand:+ start:469 stop:1116 length:648 start_codon:yes stop_codon:yes gene_type:complete
MSFGYQVLGFGMGAAAAEAEVIQNATDTANTPDTQAGDLVIALTGALTNDLPMGISGFTTIQTLTSGVLWGGSSVYYVKSSFQYKVLSGSETSISSPHNSVGMSFTQWRFPKPLTSVTTNDYNSATNSGNNPISGSYGAKTETSTIVGCLRILAQGGYNTNSHPTLTINSSEPINVVGSSYATIKSVNDFSSGSYSASAGYWSSPNFYTSMYCNA